MKQGQFARWRTNFYTGLAIVLPAIISLAVVKWLFGTVANVTDPLLFFLPRDWTHDDITNQMHWYWSLFALVLAVAIIAAIGRFARNYLGKKIIEVVDGVMLRVPLLNKIYGALKQVNEAFTSSNKSSFKQVVLVEFPRAGLYSVGFITSESHAEVQAKTSEKIISVFVPTTPNPTTGFLILVPEEKVTRLEMPVSDGIKFIISLGSVSPQYAHTEQVVVPAAEAMPTEVRIHALEKLTHRDG